MQNNCRRRDRHRGRQAAEGLLAKALRRQRMFALALVAPLFIFVAISFIIPIADMLFRSVENGIVEEILPQTVKALESWDETSGELPDEAVYAAMVADLKVARKERTNTRSVSG